MTGPQQEPWGSPLEAEPPAVGAPSFEPMDPAVAHALSCAVQLVAGYDFKDAEDASLVIAENYLDWIRAKSRESLTSRDR